jgi:hypothetical protein
MKTVFHATVDGHEVVLGFGDPHIAPVETYAIIEPLLAQLPEYVAARQAGLALAQARQAAAYVLSMARAALAAGRRTEGDHLNAEYRVREREIESMAAALTPLVEAFEARKRALVEEHAIYFHPRPGEDLISDEQAAPLQEAWADRREGYALKLDGSMIPDHRGRTFWRKYNGAWEEQIITALGLEPVAGAVAEDALDAEQRTEIAEQAEAARVAALTPEARDAEREQALQGAVARAAAMRSELEIAGDADALAKSQALYAAAQAEIAAKYGA